MILTAAEAAAAGRHLTVFSGAPLMRREEARRFRASPGKRG